MEGGREAEREGERERGGGGERLEEQTDRERGRAERGKDRQAKNVTTRRQKEEILSILFFASKSTTMRSE